MERKGLGGLKPGEDSRQEGGPGGKRQSNGRDHRTAGNKRQAASMDRKQIAPEGFLSASPVGSVSFGSAPCPGGSWPLREQF